MTKGPSPVAAPALLLAIASLFDVSIYHIIILVIILSYHFAGAYFSLLSSSSAPFCSFVFVSTQDGVTHAVQIVLVYMTPCFSSLAHPFVLKFYLFPSSSSLLAHPF